MWRNSLYATLAMALSAGDFINRENVERRTSNAEHRIGMARSYRASLRRSHTCDEDSDELVGFSEAGAQPFVRPQFVKSRKQAKPATRLAQLFQTDFQFVNEVLPRPRRLNF